MNKPAITGCVKLDEKANRICEDIDIRSEVELAQEKFMKRKNTAYSRKFWEERQIEYMQTDAYSDIVNPITVCRGVMRETLAKDEGLRQAYLSNIAMVVYDNLGECCVDECNDIAKQILQKVFGDE